jgi:hypothetical protein
LHQALKLDAPAFPEFAGLSEEAKVAQVASRLVV